MYPYQSPPPNPDDSPSPERPQGFRRLAVRLPVATPVLTYGLLGIIVLIFVYYMSLGQRAQIDFLTQWAKVNDSIRDGEYYRLFSAMFLHLNLMHILFNGYALYIIGQDVEALFGHARFAVVYFLGGLSGALASFVFTDAPSVGASGAIFAIFGAEMVYFYQHRKLHGEMGRRHLNQLIILMVINLAFGFFSSATGSFRIDNAGHIGGLIGGVVLAWFIGPEYRVQADPVTRNVEVIDANPVQKWVLPSVLYAVGLAAVMAYAVAA